jgi:type VI protein secretion system component VasF
MTLNLEKNEAMAKSIKRCVTVLVMYPILIIMILFIALLYFYYSYHLMAQILDVLYHLWN